MSDSPAFLELERLVRHLGEDLAGYRRRAIAAEARLRDVDREAAERDGGARPSRAVVAAKAREREQTSLGFLDGTEEAGALDDAEDVAEREPDAAAGAVVSRDPAGVGAAERVTALEAENAMLRQRLDVATARTRAMLERVRFLRQQRQEVGR